MSLKITDTAMTSDITTHVATAWPVPDQPDTWTVTWLAGRKLVQNEAVTAMTIAETVAVHAGNLADTSVLSNWRAHVEGWAAELGLAGPLAIAMAIKPATVPGSPNHNRSGDPCPGFCTTDHEDLVIPGKPQFGYVNTHWSDPMKAADFGAAVVRLMQPSGHDMPRVALSGSYGSVRLEFGAQEARELAMIVGDPANGPLELSAELSAAADMITAISVQAQK